MKKSARKNRAGNGERRTGNTPSLLDARVSWYKGVNARNGQRGEKSLEEVLRIISTEPIKTESRIRQLYQQRCQLIEGMPEYDRVSEEYRQLKERLFGFTPSGVCSNGRDDAGLTNYNGIVLLDFDKLPDESELERIFKLLCGQTCVLAVWRSVSGHGVKALAVWNYPDLPADKAGHRHAFSVFQKQMLQLTGRKIDEACKNESRFCFVAHDERLWINRNGLERLVIEPKEEQRAPELKSLSQDKLARLRAWVEKNGKVGAVEWTTKDGQPVGKCELCPSGRRHKDVMIFLNGIPYLHCFHPESCKEAVDSYNEQLQAAWTEIFYEDARQRCWIREKANPGRWMTVNDSGAKAELRTLGLHRKVCDDWLHGVRGWNNVRYAAPLAGYESGVHEMFNEKILVTRSPKILDPQRGSWPVLWKFQKGLLGDEQLQVFMGWLLVAYEALRSGEPRHGQALALVGPAKAGKSLLQKLITVTLGGRVKHPFKYMTGRTDFNAELFEAEHLCIDDEKASIDIRSRRELGTAIKMVCVNQEQTCFRKYATPVTLLPFWRLTISVNDDPEALQVLPPLDEDIADKLILLKTAKRPMPMPTRSGPERKQFWNTLVSELPAFLYYLTKEWRIPAKLLESEWADRYGIDSFKHADVVRELMELSPEWRLLELLDQAYFPKTEQATVFGEIKANHRQIEHKLRQEHTNPMIERLLAGPQTLVKYLGRLAKNPATRARVRKGTDTAKREWIIKPPEPRPRDFWECSPDDPDAPF